MSETRNKLHAGERAFFFTDNRDLREGSAVSQAGRAVPWHAIYLLLTAGHRAGPPATAVASAKLGRAQ